MRIVNLDNIEYMYREVETTEYKVLEYDVSTSTFETFEDTYQLQETGPLVFSYIIDNRLYFQYEKGDCMSIDLSGEEKYIYTKEKEQLDQLIHALHPEFQSNHTRIIPMGKNGDMEMIADCIVVANDMGFDHVLLAGYDNTGDMESYPNLYFSNTDYEWITDCYIREQ